MKSLFLRELSGFFSSLTGYIVIIVFLVINGLFIWVFPGDMNILDGGYANLNTLFTISPWVFLFLLPAITMRSFAEERKTNNLDLLLTRPLSELQIVLSKYGASLAVAILALIPTLFFYYAIIALGSPDMPPDSGAIAGSYIGLVLLSGAYAGIGIFASSLTDNSIVAFILAVLLCFFFYIGFNSVGFLSSEGTVGTLIINLGIEQHYQSLRRGVIDTRDVVYFISLSALFILFTRTKLVSRNW